MAPYRYMPLVGHEIRLLTLLPDDGNGRLHIVLSNEDLKPPNHPGGSSLLSRKELQSTLPAGWTVWETLDGRMIFENEETEKTSWVHPNKSFDKSLYFRSAEFREFRQTDGQPSYDALSYAWGSEDNPIEISVSSGRRASRSASSPAGTLLIRQNLAKALHCLRLADRPRTLWIDAVCINQQDVDERNQQVRRMSVIYSLASRVVVWLGPESSNSGLALATLKHLGEQLEWTRDDYRLCHPDATHHDWWRARTHLPFDDAAWQALQHLAERSWFERLWIWQEVQLASRYSIVQCGQDVVMWSVFRRAIRRLYAATQAMPTRLRDRIQYVDNLVNDHSNLSFPNWLAITARALCFDPRDKVYGLLGIAPKPIAHEIVPTYSSPIGQIYRDAFLAHLRISDTLTLLCQCDLGEKQAGIPSWVPDWSAPRRAAILVGSGFLASGLSLSHANYRPPVSLEVLGIKSATIISITSPCSRDRQQAMKDIRSWAPKGLDEATYRTGETLLDAFVSTLCANELYDYTDIYLDPTLKHAKDSFLAHFGPSAGDAAAADFTDLFLMSILRWVPGRVFFTTAEGYIGLAPSAARPGDFICIILGCPMPIILRAHPSGSFQVVGVGYVHGLMHSEGILGALPEPWVCKLVRTNSMWLIERFFNSLTGETTPNDPRLGPLPPEWELVDESAATYPRAASLRFGNTRTKEVVDGDPRLVPEALRRRGVNIQSFLLV